MRQESQQNTVVGVWDGHDAGAALVVGGQLVAASSEERHTRRKNQGGWPQQSIAEVLALQGISASAVDTVAVAGCFGRAPARLFNRQYAAQDPRRIDPLALNSQAFAAFQHAIAALPGVRATEQWAGAQPIRRALAELGLQRAKLQFVDHHRAHAAGAAAWLGAPGLIVTMDGYGDGVSLAVWRAGEGRLQRLFAAGPRASLALVYGAANRLLGFAEGEEGKVTGLAAQGNPHAAWTAGLARCIRVGNGTCAIDQTDAVGVLRAALHRGISPADLAAGVHATVAQAATAVVDDWLLSTGLRHLAVSGGLFANVALNGTLAARDLTAFAVCPAMGDQGLCAGAALAAAGSLAGSWPTVLLGHTIATTAGPDPRAVAEVLAAGGLVAVARGALEFGPRALGNRSILADPRAPAAADRLNAALQRHDFMPFAPVVAVESWPAIFAVPLERVRASAAAMTLALPTSPAFQAQAPAAVHCDGTARPQAVNTHDSAWLHAVLRHFTQLTGCPALLNTSLNRHGEPIARTLGEARAVAVAAQLDWLVAGDTLEALRPVAGVG